MKQKKLFLNLFLIIGLVLSSDAHITQAAPSASQSNQLRPAVDETGGTASMQANKIITTDASLPANPSQSNTFQQAGSGELAGPPDSVMFGTGIVVLPNGNFVVTDLQFSSAGKLNVGAVYLYDGETQALISRTIGTTDNDMVGSGGITVLEDGNFVIVSPRWNNGLVTMAGAVTACSAVMGCPETVTVGNSLVGSHPNDKVGSFDTNEELSPPNYSDYANIKILGGSAYLVGSPNWDDEKGAATYCAGGSSPGCLGEVSSTNSLVGSTGKGDRASGDKIGNFILLYPGGGYIVYSDDWTNGGNETAGAVTPCPASGCTGPVSTSNSLYGPNSASGLGRRVVLLSRGGFIVENLNSAGSTVRPGAVTFCASLMDPRCVGQPASANNSLLGTAPFNFVGGGELVALPDGGYLVGSPNLSSGALTYCAVSGGTSSCTGQTVSLANSLWGDQQSDQVGRDVTLLPNGAFVVASTEWHNYTGAVMYCSSPAACLGQSVTAENSLVGGNAGDYLGHFVLALSNGGYAVFSPDWDPFGSNSQLGAVTFCPPTGCTGKVTIENSLIGSKANDQVGDGGGIQLPNGAVLVSSIYWGYDPGDGTGIRANAGAVTYCAAPADCMGATVERSNSLVADQADTEFGFLGPPQILSNGSYLVNTNFWDNGKAVNAGAVTWCPASGCQDMVISETNSLVGSQSEDSVGVADFILDYFSSGVEDVGDGLYVVQSSDWKNGNILAAGAVTVCSQSGGCSGPVTSNIGVLGSVEGYHAWAEYRSSYNTFQYDSFHHRLFVGLPLENRVVLFKPAPFITSKEAAGTVELGSAAMVTASVVASEGTSIDSVTLRVLSPEAQDYPMAHGTGSQYSASLLPAQIGEYTYRVFATNTEGQTGQSAQDTFIVQDTTAPSFENQAQSSNHVEVGGTNTLTAFGHDLGGLVRAVLSVNENGTWQNYDWPVSDWWNHSWTHRRAVTLTENAGLARTNEMVELMPGVNVYPGLESCSELRVVDQNQVEVPMQAIETRPAPYLDCTIFFQASVAANSSRTYYVYFGNPTAPAPSYPSDLHVSTNGSLVTIRNPYFDVDLDRSAGILSRVRLPAGSNTDLPLATPLSVNHYWGWHQACSEYYEIITGRNDLCQIVSEPEVSLDFTETISGPLVREFTLTSTQPGYEMYTIWFRFFAGSPYYQYSIEPADYYDAPTIFFWYTDNISYRLLSGGQGSTPQATYNTYDYGNDHVRIATLSYSDYGFPRGAGYLGTSIGGRISHQEDSLNLYVTTGANQTEAQSVLARLDSTLFRPFGQFETMYPGTYNSPNLLNSTTMWPRAYFYWQNSNIQNQSVLWYITFYDASGNQTTTPVMSFDVGGPTAVKLSSIIAKAENKKVVLDWETANEIGLVGFNVYRSESPDGTKEKQNMELISAEHPGQMLGAGYQFHQAVKPGQHYYYWLEWVDEEGAVFEGPVIVQTDYYLFVPFVSQ